MVRSKDPMWCMVMFDLPVTTAVERRNANGFRRHLTDLGFCMLQYSVYIKYTPVAGGDGWIVKMIRGAIPSGGAVHILHLTDRQWASTMRFINSIESKPDDSPQQLQIF
ncbi:CRISPR-associated endonuclease Cas2 [Bowdeniella nasicola]|uniref:CRISPR-associated endoribonuclease Cas2 n=2 Tax=Bowdeniella nasicola TaxID=208480 RepID=A0A1Q5PW10_9ACTO|nr:CRISPR-associated endonuclease Cas2 [Bowdeniella nasicola]